MAARKRSKVSVTTDTNTYRLSANERREARFAEISNKQADLKREAAERGAKRANEDQVAHAAGTLNAVPAKRDAGEASTPRPGGVEQGHPA
jgi:hypothetical protein